MDTTGISTVILAAGSSSRMGRFKPLMELGGRSVVERVVSVFWEAGINDIRVVTGHCSMELEPHLERLGVRSLVNANHVDGMFSSVLRALDDLESDVRAVFILPVDIPLIRAWTLLRLLERHREYPDRIVVPSFRGRRGHPVVIPARYLQAIREWSGAEGLRGALGVHGRETFEVPVADRNILFDVDTPEEYTECLRRWSRYEIPTTDECEALLQDVCHVDEHVLAHCRAVAAVAGRLCDVLNDAGCPVDRELAVAAGLLHDMAKGRPDHDQAAARQLMGMGYGELARIVGSHKDIMCSRDTQVGCDEVLYLADKLVRGSTVCTLEERFREAFRKNAHSPQALSRIGKRMQDALAIRDRIEAATCGGYGRIIMREVRGT
jgi:putative nucleotidyltransferase with HDIG domain